MKDKLNKLGDFSEVLSRTLIKTLDMTARTLASIYLWSDQRIVLAAVSAYLGASVIVEVVSYVYKEAHNG